MWQWIGRILCGCAAFQPLNFVAWRQWRKAAEFQCDAWAVRYGADRFALARCLTSIAEWRHPQAFPVLVLPGDAAPGELTERVERLLGETDDLTRAERRLPRPVVALGLGAVAVVFCFLLPGLETQGGMSPDASVKVVGPEAERRADAGSIDSPEMSEVSTELLVEQLLTLDREVHSLRTAMEEVEGLAREAGALSRSRGLAHGIASRLERIEHRRNELLQLSQRLAQERRTP